MREFQAPMEHSSQQNGKTVFKPLDQTLITAVMIILIALLTWMAYTTQQLSVNMATLTTKFEAAEQKRDMNYLYLDRRLENLEKEIKEQSTKR